MQVSFRQTYKSILSDVVGIVNIRTQNDMPKMIVGATALFCLKNQFKHQSTYCRNRFNDLTVKYSLPDFYARQGRLPNSYSHQMHLILNILLFNCLRLLLSQSLSQIFHKSLVTQTFCTNALPYDFRNFLGFSHANLFWVTVLSIRPIAVVLCSGYAASWCAP